MGECSFDMSENFSLQIIQMKLFSEFSINFQPFLATFDYKLPQTPLDFKS